MIHNNNTSNIIGTRFNILLSSSSSAIYPRYYWIRRQIRSNRLRKLWRVTDHHLPKSHSHSINCRSSSSSIDSSDASYVFINKTFTAATTTTAAVAATWSWIIVIVVITKMLSIYCIVFHIIRHNRHKQITRIHSTRCIFQHKENKSVPGNAKQSNHGII